MTPASHPPHHLRNRLLMSILAVTLMWATSLRVAVYVVSFFVDVPPFDSVVDSCKNTYRITREERRRFADCVDLQVDQCNNDLADASYKETRRVNTTEATNKATVDAARRIQSNCSSAYSSLRYSIEAWVDAGHTVPYHQGESGSDNDSDNSTSSISACTADDLNQLTNSVGDISAVRTEAFSVSSQYSDESQSTIRRLVDYAQLRAAYDAEYIGNHTLSIENQIIDYANGIEVPPLNVEELFDEVQADVDMLVSCISLRSADEGGECSSMRGAQERLAIIHSEMERRMEVYRKEIDSWRTKVNKYKSNVQSAYETAVRFYRGVKRAIPDWFSFFGKSDWWDIEVEDIIPLGVAFPGSTPTFTELPSLDDVWDSVSVSLDFFRMQLESAEAKAVRMAKELGNDFERNMILNLPNVTPADYNPPTYRGSNSDVSGLDEEETRHAKRSQVFMERTAVALDAFSELSQSESNEEILGDASSFFNITSIQTKLSNVDISFKSLIRPGIDFDVWFLRLNSFGDVLFLFDLLYRLYNTVRVIYKYWIAGDMKLPEVDMRNAASRESAGTRRSRKKQISTAAAAASSNAKKMLGTGSIHLLVRILIHPAVGFAIFVFSIWWVVSIAVSLYSPLYQEYMAGCVVSDGNSNGTFLTSNLLSLSYNHAYQDGSTKLLEGLDRFDAERGEICASRYAPSASRYQNDATIFASLFDTHNVTASKMGLMERCIDFDAFDSAFRDTCCNVDAYSYLSSSSCPVDAASNSVSGNSTCPMNELVQPPAPFLPPSVYVVASSCDVDMKPVSQEEILEQDSTFESPSSFPWEIKDSIFQCDAMPYCDVTCEGPNQEVLGQTTRECGCTVEWFLHSLWLKVVLSLMVYGITNASRIGFVNGLSRLLWHRLHPDHFTLLSSCHGDGTLMNKHHTKIDDSNEQNEEDAAALIRHEIDRNMLQFQAKGLAMVACAVFANIAWIYALRLVNSSSTPSWLVD